MTSTPRHIFPKAEKLKSRKQIDLLFQGGKSFFAAPVKCFYRVERLMGSQVDELVEVKSETENVKMETGAEIRTSNIRRPELVEGKLPTSNILAGVSVSKKNFKKSTDRNRIKRLLREAYRLHKHKLQEKLADGTVSLEVFFVFTDKTLPDFALVEEKMKYCIRRLGKIVEGGV
jgi:ribonuclease P protein component